MRKHESLFYKINTCLQKTTTHTGLQTKQIFSVKILIFFQFWVWLLRFLFNVISRSSSFLWQKKKKNWNNFFGTFFLVQFFWYLYELKSVSQIFNILFQTGNINIFALWDVAFSRSVQLKSSFSDKKNISNKIWDRL